MEKGAIYHIETMGLVDGPGIRTVFFLQGCPLKCAYCHNPESQALYKKTPLFSPEELVNKALRYEGYYKRTGGGVTFSGGEPLMQSAFLIKALDALKSKGIHTVLDTSGYGSFHLQEEVLRRVDMVLLDIKEVREAQHAKLTGVSLAGVQEFILKLQRFKGKIWIRHVMIPGLTDTKEAMLGLIEQIKPILKQVEKIEILPYHKLGSEKYSQLNIEDPFSQVEEMDVEQAKALEKYVNCLLVHPSKTCFIEDVV